MTDPTTTAPDTRLCRSDYAADTGRTHHRGDRLVLCGLPFGHEGDHDEVIDGEHLVNTWPRRPAPATVDADLRATIAYALHDDLCVSSAGWPCDDEAEHFHTTDRVLAALTSAGWPCDDEADNLLTELDEYRKALARLDEYNTEVGTPGQAVTWVLRRATDAEAEVERLTAERIQLHQAIADAAGGQSWVGRDPRAHQYAIAAVEMLSVAASNQPDNPHVTAAREAREKLRRLVEGLGAIFDIATDRDEDLELNWVGIVANHMQSARKDRQRLKRASIEIKEARESLRLVSSLHADSQAILAVAAERDAARAEVERLTAERDALDAQVRTLHEHQDEIMGAALRHESVDPERGQLIRDTIAAMLEFGWRHPQEVGRLTSERDDLRERADTLARDLAEAQRQRDESDTELDRLADEGLLVALAEEEESVVDTALRIMRERGEWGVEMRAKLAKLRIGIKAYADDLDSGLAFMDTTQANERSRTATALRILLDDTTPAIPSDQSSTEAHHG